MLPYYVATKMSRIRNPNVFAPGPTTYVRQALGTVGVESRTMGCWSHALQVCTLMNVKPRQGSILSALLCTYHLSSPCLASLFIASRPLQSRFLLSYPFLSRSLPSRPFTSHPALLCPFSSRPVPSSPVPSFQVIFCTRSVI